jgi:hypothetical protein
VVGSKATDLDHSLMHVQRGAVGKQSLHENLPGSALA